MKSLLFLDQARSNSEVAGMFGRARQSTILAFLVLVANSYRALLVTLARSWIHAAWSL